MGIDFKGFFQFLLFIAVLLAIIMFLVGNFLTSDSIRSDKPIEPKIELIIKDNRVDTVYIYEKP